MMMMMKKGGGGGKIIIIVANTILHKLRNIKTMTTVIMGWQLRDQHNSLD